MLNVPQELVVVIIAVVVISFILFVTISSRRKKDGDTDKGTNSNSKWFIDGRGNAMDQDKIIFYAVLGTVVIIVSIVRLIGWRKEKRQEKENEK